MRWPRRWLETLALLPAVAVPFQERSIEKRSRLALVCDYSYARDRMIAKVLFPVDFSPACVAVVPYVKCAEGLFGPRARATHLGGTCFGEHVNSQLLCY
jgi:hypothetical protein